MNRTLKTVLLWLLMAALPLQGFAAAVRISCGGAHHGAWQTILETQVPQAADHNHHHEAANHHHHADTSGAHADSSTADGNTPNTQNQHLNSTCSACAACCVGAAAPPCAPMPAPACPSTESFVAYSTAILASHIPAGLERPPRPLS